MNTSQNKLVATGILLIALLTSVRGSEIYQAAYKGDFEKVKALVASNPRGIDEKEEKGGNSALHGAIFGGHNEIAEFLVAHKADVNSRTKYDVTPLHSAVKRKNSRVVELLLKSGADVNAKAVEQITPLHFSITNYGPGMDEVISLLLAHKAGPKIKSAQGRTALDLAKAKNLTTVVELIKKQQSKK